MKKLLLCLSSLFIFLASGCGAGKPETHSFVWTDINARRPAAYHVYTEYDEDGELLLKSDTYIKVPEYITLEYLKKNGNTTTPTGYKDYTRSVKYLDENYYQISETMSPDDKEFDSEKFYTSMVENNPGVIQDPSGAEFDEALQQVQDAEAVIDIADDLKDFGESLLEYQAKYDELKQEIKRLEQSTIENGRDYGNHTVNVIIETAQTGHIIDEAVKNLDEDIESGVVPMTEEELLYYDWIKSQITCLDKGDE